MKLIDFSDDDELYLFERVVKNLQSFYGHSESDAIRMVNEYYHKFTNAEFCHRYNIPVQTVDFFFILRNQEWQIEFTIIKH